MKVELHEITIREVVKNYSDKGDEGVIGYSGRLNIRPKYQREFVYKDVQRSAVIDTIFKGFPLNVIYWAVNEDGTFEVLDGQQRTISFCQYVNGDYSIVIDGNAMAFHNLTETMKNQILDYKLMVYFCEGNDKEKLDWFKIVNIAGVELTYQELRNAVYTGTWLSDAKSKFSRRKCPAYMLANEYLKGDVIRQEFLETAIEWINKGDIDGYMSKHQQDPNANELWTYFKNVIDWVKLTFPVYRNVMKGIEWGFLYDKYHTLTLDTKALDEEIKHLMEDEDITKQSGIYSYVLTREEKYLNVRAFSPQQKQMAYERQNGICPKCEKPFKIEEMDGDHIMPWAEGGKTIPGNCQMLCKECNRRKGKR